MKNLMKKIATSLSLALIVASLVVINPNQAQAKTKKRAGNSAKVNSQAKHISARNGSGSNANRLHLEDVSLGRKANGNNLTDTMVTGVKANSQVKRRGGRNGKVRAGWDIRQPNM